MKDVDYPFVVRLRFADFREFGMKREETPWAARLPADFCSTPGIRWPSGRHRGRLSCRMPSRLFPVFPYDDC
ncbi:hypothetical protein [Paraburkholderia sp. J11-2]|uniref:hypothetical protein n=1 Tax=Paraburkholderia sp. J11-2 TaxID=2805431 RepID=UPI002AB5E172|nr:hypothetical protein [Paraburkholderia sp. J11-2]